MSHGSNQYPPLPWQHHVEAVHKGFIAWPHGPEGGRARVYWQVNHPKHTQWVWTVGWAGRFSTSGMEAEKQAAADKATMAYWDAMERTEGWKPAPPPPAPMPLPLPERMIRINVFRWLQTARQEEAKARLRIYLMAGNGRSDVISGTRELDRWIWARLAGAWQRLPQ